MVVSADKLLDPFGRAFEKALKWTEILVPVSISQGFWRKVRAYDIWPANCGGPYYFICYTGVWPAELVNHERKAPKDGSLDELFRAKAVILAEVGAVDDGQEHEEPMDEGCLQIYALLLKETAGRYRPKALCYEDILVMIVRHPVTGQDTLAMSIKFIRHKGCDNKPRPTIFFFTPSKKMIFCPILLFLGLALSGHAFDAPSLMDANAVFAWKVPSGQPSLPLRWREAKLKTPFFRRMSRDGTLSDVEAMFYATLQEHMVRQSLNAGF
ncbi:hypothetical protein BJ170DRAFT_682059 [Xylariales sp. AK1849]|nr:hypothetical protein BJ170DRAFT_682059 [Xylariales sp. AK1849]